MKVSVVIPALNEAGSITACVRAARRGYSPAEVEIVVVDGGSTDGTPGLVPAGERVVHAPRGRAVQMNRGAAATGGGVLVFCHADSLLPAGWREEVLAQLALPRTSGGSFQTRFRPAAGFLGVLNLLSTRADWRIMYGDQAQFMRRASFERTGGFPPIPLMEDVEMARALHRLGRLRRSRLPVITSGRRFIERGPLRQAVLSVTCMLRYLYMGATPQAIARAYRSSRETP